MEQMGSTERYTLNVITDPWPHVRIEDNEEDDWVASYSGPDALLKASKKLAELQWRDAIGAADTNACCSKLGPENVPCGLPCVFLTAEQAQEAGRGEYSGWYHVTPVAGHHAVPKSWVS